MNKVVKVFTTIKVFLVICMFASFAFATDPGGPATGVGSPNGPQVGMDPVTCGFPTNNSQIGWWFLILIFTIGIVGAIMSYVISGTNKNKSNVSPEPPVTEDRPPLSTTGGEARMIEPSGASKTVALKVGSNSIGRDSNQDIQLDDPKVSKKHADLNVSPSGKYVVTDLGSQNGTTVNGIKISQQELYQGDQIGLGDSRIIV